MKKLSDRDKKMLFILAAIAILAASYFLIFNKFNTKKEELQTQNTQLQTEVSGLETMVAGKQKVLDDTQNKQNKIAEVLAKFPAEVRTQNVIYSLNKMYEGIDDVKIQSETYNMDQVFYQQGQVSSGSAPTTTTTANGVAAAPNPAATGSAINSTSNTTAAKDVIQAAADYTGFKSDIVVTFTAPYESLKEVIDYVNKNKDRMTITDISATVDGEDATVLNCNMTISMYAITGTGKVYKAPDISGVGSGLDNIFDGADK